MKSTLWQLAIRRWADMFRSPFLYLAFFTMVMGMTAAGPAGTFTDYPYFRRLGFAFAANSSCWAIGLFFTPIIRIALEMRGVSRSWSIIGGIGTSILIMFPIFYSLMVWEFSELNMPITRLIEIFATLGLLIAVIAYGLIAPKFSAKQNRAAYEQNTPDPVISHARRKQDKDEPEECLIQSKIPATKRGTLLAMVAQDHYVEVITTNGSELILMRLSDAINLCESDIAMQIHRSAWITKMGLGKIKKDGRKLTVVLPNGRELPVARSANAEVREFAEKFSGDKLPIAS